MQEQAQTGTAVAVHAIEILTQAEYQEQQADRLEREVFGSQENAGKTGNLISEFVTSYEQHKRDMPLDQWLIQQFREYPTLWQDAAELESTAHEVIRTVERNNASKVSLHEHLGKGKSRESWLAKRIEEGASAAGVVNVGAYATGIDRALQQANEGMNSTLFTKSGNINLNPNLDGFIAEQHHVDTFNVDAATQGSGYQAKVLTPDGNAYGKNSMDIGIYDKSGKLVKRYQVKYGKDAESTGKLFEKGDYRGQRKLVPADQVDEMKNATDTLEIDGVKSKPLTKEQAKTLQEQAQRDAEAKQYDWNDINRIDIAKNIGKQALIGAAFTAAMQGGRILGRRAWNWMIGKKTPPASEDLKEFFLSSVGSATHTGVQVAVSGAVVVAVKNGWVGSLLKNTPAGRIVNAVSVGMENAKILYKLAQGKLTAQEALDAMGSSTTAMLGGLAVAAEGVALGATLGMVLGPIGAGIGGLVGGVIGGMAGSVFAKGVYEGGKVAVTTVVNAVKSTVTSVANSVSHGMRSLASAFSSFF